MNMKPLNKVINKGGSRDDATTNMEHFVITVNDSQPLTVITKRSILDVAAALDPPLISKSNKHKLFNK